MDQVPGCIWHGHDHGCAKCLPTLGCYGNLKIARALPWFFFLTPNSFHRTVLSYCSLGQMPQPAVEQVMRYFLLSLTLPRPALAASLCWIIQVSSGKVHVVTLSVPSFSYIRIQVSELPLFGQIDFWKFLNTLEVPPNTSDSTFSSYPILLLI